MSISGITRHAILFVSGDGMDGDDASTFILRRVRSVVVGYRSRRADPHPYYDSLGYRVPAPASGASRTGFASGHQSLLPLLAMADHRHGDAGVGCRASQAPREVRMLHSVKRWLNQNEKMIPERERRKLDEVLPKSRVLLTMMTMRRELAAIWGRSAATREQLVRQLQDWCHRAEASGIAPLAEFSRRLRQYA
jgi:hypothetical protein